ncbi:TetR/AcrR family transcriptional regulator [Celeribacter sp.]|uniref:TetR/AcrR family transcriptional regulator n=1 Tax=Celeribacter sp. TaxID=1890673 RepID=UPI003A901F95
MSQTDAPQDPEASNDTPKFRRRKEDRPDELLDAAIDLFTENGFDRTRVADIAERAGLSKGAVYLYFPSKTAIIEALVERAVGGVADEIAATFADFNGDPRLLLGQVALHIEAKISDPRIFAVPKLVVREAATHPQLAALYRTRVLDKVLPAATAMFARAMDAGLIRRTDPEMLVRCMFGPVIMHILLDEVFAVRPAQGRDLRGLIETHLMLLSEGLAPLSPSESVPAKEPHNG